MKKNFDHKNLNKNWYLEWEKKKFLLPDYKKIKSYCITIPPPNITGTLHMGHAFQSTLMDVLIRFYKMNNYCTLWKMGTDHAGIATQILIEQKIKNQNIEQLVKYAKKWSKKSNKTIKNQLKTLGCSLNWKTKRFTLDKHFSYAVKTAFITLYKENLIYKAKKLVNWDTKIKTAISDLEVIHEEVNSELFYIKYKTNNENTNITVATTRPETIFADTAIAINPNDKRYKNINFTHVKIPLTNKIIPIIFDNNVNQNFGTGCLKITPGHDFLDFEIGKKHNLPIINLFNEDGTINDYAPEKYRKLTIQDAKKKIKTDLIQEHYIEKIEPYKNKIPKADRSNSIIEPIITEQWYIKTKPLAEPVYDEIKNNKIKIIPKKWKKIFFDWIENIKDWCISRQIWWGHQIPIWYDDEKNEYTGYSKEYIIKKYNINKNKILIQDKNVLDTWFSSALWPFASLGWPNEKKIEYKKLYPTATLITGFDIIFFWAIKMMMFGIKFTNKMPFKEIYIHGLIRDNLGNKMSKTKGNVIDPLDIINGISKELLIKKQTSNLLNEKNKDNIINYTKNQFPNGIESFGTDALRLTFCSIATENIAIKLDFEKLKNYKSFCTKLWNAAIFIKNIKNNTKKTKQNASIYNNYILSLWQSVKKEIRTSLKNRKFNLTIEIIYKFFWTNFCNWHIECSKILLQNKKYGKETIKNNIKIFKEILKILHPFAPYITEEIWNNINKNSTFLINQKYPKQNKKLINKKLEKNIEQIKQICSKIRNLKKENKINYTLFIIKLFRKNELLNLERNKEIIKKLSKIDKLMLQEKI